MVKVEDILVDGIGGVAVTGGVVRMELQQLASLAQASEAPQMQTAARLAFSIDTLLKFNQAVTALLTNLESRGVLTKTGSEQPVDAGKKCPSSSSRGHVRPGGFRNLDMSALPLIPHPQLFIAPLSRIGLTRRPSHG